MKNRFEQAVEKEKEYVAECQRRIDQGIEGQRHRDQMTVQDRSATAAEKIAKIAKWSLGVAIVALFFSLTGWSIPVIVEWFRNLDK